MKSLFITAFVALALLIVSCSPAQKNQPAEEAAAQPEPVRVLTLDYQSIFRSVDYTASLQAWEEIHLAPAAPGRIDNITVEVGSHVNRGDLLVQMNRTQLHQAEVQLRTLEADFNRFDTLRKAGSIAQQQYDQISAQLDIARKNVAFLSENTQLRAPFSGVISGKYFEAGEMFSGAPNPLIGAAAIVTLIQLDRLKAIVPVSERFFPQIKSGMQASVTTDILPEQVFPGRVFRIHPTIDPLSRTFNVEVVIDNRDGNLRPGMFSRVSFDLEQVQAMLVPNIAVLKLQGSNERYLFKEENGLAVRVPVDLGARFDHKVEVISNQLQQGDRIVVSGQARLLDGVNVKVIE